MSRISQSDPRRREKGYRDNREKGRRNEEGYRANSEEVRRTGDEFRVDPEEVRRMMEEEPETLSPGQIRRRQRAKMESPKAAQKRRREARKEALREEVRKRLYAPQPVNVNKEIFVVALFFTLLFTGFAAYFIHYVQFEKDEYIVSPYNRRQDVLEEKVIRGSILASGGEVLAVSYLNEEGEEQRSYPYEGLFAHAVGYADNGKSGLESSYNYYLLASHTNLRDQVVNDLQEKKNQGDSLVTTLDLSLQQTAREAIGSYKGAVIALEPSTGKVLAMVSRPGFDPNTIGEDWEELVSEENTDANLVNRATQGLYPPGSVFKILTALEFRREAGQQGIDSFEYDCDGIFSDGTDSIACYNGAEHGWENFRSAFANSCNGAFCDIGLRLDKAAFRELCETCFFNESFDFSLATTSGSFALDGNSTSWQAMQTAIGQGETLVTPLQMAMITCGIANGGRVMKPTLVSRVESAEGALVKEFEPEAYRDIMTAGESAFLTDIMTSVVNNGTGSVLWTEDYQAACKTGTAQYETGNDSAHSWIVAFAPAEEPKIVVAVVLEDIGSGSGAANYVAREVLDEYLLR